MKKCLIIWKGSLTRLSVFLAFILISAVQLKAQTASYKDAGLGWPYTYCIDGIAARPGYLEVWGWAFANDKSSQIKLIFGSSEGDKHINLGKRQDVINAYGLPSSMNTGFHVYLPFTAGTYSESIICHALNGTTPYRIFYMSATITKPTATFDMQGGTGGTASTSVDFNKANPVITIPVKSGYYFAGYYTQTNGSGTKYYNSNGTSAENWKEVGGKTLYAKWETIELTVSESGYATFFADRNTVVPEGVEVYGFTYSDGSLVRSSLILTGTVLSANKGYLVKATAGTYRFAPTDAAATAPETSLIGTVSEINTPAGDVYVWGKPDGYDYGFYKYTGAKIGAGKSYFVKP